jgi:hypothetical protein
MKEMLLKETGVEVSIHDIWEALRVQTAAFQPIYSLPVV